MDLGLGGDPGPVDELVALGGQFPELAPLAFPRGRSRCRANLQQSELPTALTDIIDSIGKRY